MQVCGQTSKRHASSNLPAFASKMEMQKTTLKPQEGTANQKSLPTAPLRPAPKHLVTSRRSHPARRYSWSITARRSNPVQWCFSCAASSVGVSRDTRTVRKHFVQMHSLLFSGRRTNVGIAIPPSTPPAVAPSVTHPTEPQDRRPHHQAPPSRPPPDSVILIRRSQNLRICLCRCSFFPHRRTPSC